MSDFMSFGMMDPFSMMMGMGFGDEEDTMDCMIMQEFAAKNVKLLKGNLTFYQLPWYSHMFINLR